MNNKPLVTIIIPVYNAENYLEENIKSVLGQTYDNIEVIYVCDGCTDNSTVVLKRYSYDKRLRIIDRHNNVGAAASRNQGIMESKGDWLIFWDSDDIICKDAIKLLVNAAIDNKADLALCSYGIAGEEELVENDNWLFNYLKEIIPDFPLFINDKQIYDLSSMLICNAPFNKLISRKIITEGNLFFQEIKNCNDVFFSAAVFLYSERTVYVEKKVYWYRNNSIGNLSSKRTDFHSCILEALSLVRETLLKLNYSEDVFKNYAFCEIEGYRGTKVYENLIDEYYAQYEKRWKIPLNNNYLFSPKNPVSLKGKRIVIFGAGQVGKDYFQALKAISIIIGWIDTKVTNESIMNISMINNMCFDYVIIATKSYYYALQMERQLISLGVAPQKIIMEYPRYNLITNN